MKLSSYFLFVLVVISILISSTANAQIDQTSNSEAELALISNDSIELSDFNFSVEKSVVNKSLWTQPYRYENKDLKALSVQLVIEPINDNNEPLDFNLFYLLDESKKLRVRPNAVFYYRSLDKKVYLKSKPINKNYNYFAEKKVEGFDNFEAETYKPNFLGMKKKKIKSTVQLLKKVNIKPKKTTYYLDFPVQQGFAYGKIYYKNSPIGFAAVQTKVENKK